MVPGGVPMLFPGLFPEMFLVMDPGMAPGKGRTDGPKVTIHGWVPGVFLGRERRRERKEGRGGDFLERTGWGSSELLVVRCLWAELCQCRTDCPHGTDHPHLPFWSSPGRVPCTE